MRNWLMTFKIDSELENIVDIPALSQSINHLVNQFPGLTCSVVECVCPEGPMKYNVVLIDPGNKKIQVIKETRAFVRGLGLKEAKDLVDGASAGKDQVILRSVSEDEAKECQRAFEMAGATVEVEASFVPQFIIDNAVNGTQAILEELEGGQAA